MALLRCLPALEKGPWAGDEQVGVDIVKRALEEPARQVAENAGYEGAIAVEKIKRASNKNEGFNAETEQMEDLFQAGIIDPTKVVRTALQNAASIASLLLTTEAPKEREKKAAPAC